jgi:hypothetical protein
MAQDGLKAPQAPFTAGLVPRCSEPSRTHALHAPLRGGLRPSLTAPARRSRLGASGRRASRPFNPGLRPGSNKGLTGKKVAGLLALCSSTPNRHGLGNGNIGSRCQLPHLFRCELGCIGTVADHAVRHPALDPGQRVQGIAIKGGFRGHDTGRVLDSRLERKPLKTG